MSSILILTSRSPSEAWEQDCACDEPNGDIITGFNPQETMTIAVSKGWWLLHSPHSSRSALLNRGAYQAWRALASSPAYARSEKAAQAAQYLKQWGFLQEEHGATDCSSSPTQLVAWLHLTDRCNLRCDYCYLPHQRLDMSWESGQAVLATIFRTAQKHGFRRVKIKYAGGEPLLRQEMLFALHRLAQEQAQQAGLGLDGVILTNGTLLTEDILAQIRAANLRLMISLDGIGAAHDVQRHYASGRGSFADVMEAIELALEARVRPHISITVSGRNAEALPEVLAWLLERGLRFSINFYRENPLSVQFSDLRLEETKIIQGMRAALRVIEANLPPWPLLDNLLDRTRLSTPHRYPCGVGRSYLVFTPQGGIAKCHMLLHQPVTHFHEADPLTVLRSTPQGLQNPSVDEKDECRSCPWRYWCAGGCPLVSYQASGEYSHRSPNCHIYQALFPEILRLEGLRLLHYRHHPELVDSIAL